MLRLLNDPGVIQCVFGTDALLDVESEELSDEVFCLFADGLPLFLFETVAALFDLLDDLVLGLTVEGRVAHQ